MSASDAEQALDAVLEQRGYARSETGTATSVEIFEVENGTVLISSVIPGRELARALSIRAGVDARYAEVDLDDSEVRGDVRTIEANGDEGVVEDLDELLSETCEEWFEGRKYLSEAHDGLIAIALDLEATDVDRGTTLRYARVGSTRVWQLVDAIRGGARWEKVDMGGRPAIKLIAPSGSRMSVLSIEEMALFENLI